MELYNLIRLLSLFIVYLPLNAILGSREQLRDESSISRENSVIQVNELRDELVRLIDNKLKSRYNYSYTVNESNKHNNQTSINRYLTSLSRLQVYISAQIYSIKNNLSSFIDMLLIATNLITFGSVLALIGGLISLLLTRALSIYIKQNIFNFILFLIINNISEIFILICGLVPSDLITNVINTKFNFIKGISYTDNILRILSDISALTLLQSVFIQIINQFITNLSLANIINRGLYSIFSMKIIKLLILDLTKYIKSSGVEFLRSDLNQLETLITALIITFTVLQLQSITNLRNLKINNVLRYVAIPILGMALVAYLSNNQGVQFTYKLLLAISIWPLLYNVYSIIRSSTYLYLKKLPSHSIRHPIKIWLLIINLARYAVIPSAIIIIMYIFEINLLEELRTYLGNSVYYKSISLFLIMLTIRILFIINSYLTNLYAHINITKRPFDKQRIITSALIIKNIISTLAIIITILIVLSIFGFNISPLFQTIGLFSAAMSLSLQQVIRDLVNGVFILYENSIRIGDWIDYDNKTAVVEDMSLRYMRVRLDDGLLITIPFHKLDIIKNKSRQYSYIVLNISIDRRCDLIITEQAIEEAFINIRERPEFKYKILKDLEMRDLADATAFSYVIQCRVCVQPNSQYRIRRAFNKELKVIFDKYQIVIATPPVANASMVPSLNTCEPYPDFQ